MVRFSSQTNSIERMKVLKYKLNLETMTDVKKFVESISHVNGSVTIEDGSGNYRCNAKSIIGVLASMEWDDVWLVSDTDVYGHIVDYVAE